MFISFYVHRTDPSSQVKVRLEENDGMKLFIAINGLDDTSSIVQLFGTLEGP